MAGKDLVWALEEIGLRNPATITVQSMPCFSSYDYTVTIRWFVFGLILSKEVTESNMERSHLADLSSVIPAR